MPGFQQLFTGPNSPTGMQGYTTTSTKQLVATSSASPPLFTPTGSEDVEFAEGKPEQHKATSAKQRAPARVKLSQCVSCLSAFDDAPNESYSLNVSIYNAEEVRAAHRKTASATLSRGKKHEQQHYSSYTVTSLCTCKLFSGYTRFIVSDLDNRWKGSRALRQLQATWILRLSARQDRASRRPPALRTTLGVRLERGTATKAGCDNKNAGSVRQVHQRGR